MKIAVHKIIVAVFVLFSSQLSIASEITETPPPPTPPPGLPIDGGIVVMFFAALVLGYLFLEDIYLQKKALYKSFFYFCKS